MSRLNATVASETLKALFGYMDRRYGRVHLVIEERNLKNNAAGEALQKYVSKGVLVLNIGGTAVKNLIIDHEGVSFEARFGRVPHYCHFKQNEILGVVDFDSDLIILTNVILGTLLDGTAYSIELKEDDEMAGEGVERVAPAVTSVGDNVVYAEFGKKK